MTLWAAEWYSKNKLDGERRHIIYANGVPALFRSRRACRNFINDQYGEIRDRSDLREEPHGWGIPKAIKVIVERVK